MTLLTMVLMALPQLVNSQVTNGVFPPGSTNYGKSYGEWEEAWYQWAVSLPVGRHPLFDTGEASAGQSGPVWFLGGNFTGTPATRSVRVPSGKALFFPILNYEYDNTDCDTNNMRFSDGLTEAQLRGVIKANLDAAHDMSCTIDGVPVQGLTAATNAYRVQTPTPGGFSFTLPGLDNILDHFGYACWRDPSGAPITVDASIYHPVADGTYLMVAPLSEGDHTIHFSGAVGDPTSFALDITYHLTIVPTNGVFGTNAIVSGKSYGEWSQAWWQWLLSIPAAQNPNEDTNGQFAAVGQSGPVWFVSGSFGDLGYPLSRTFAIPEGKNLFLPVYNWLFGSCAGDCDPSNPGVTCDIPTLRADAATATTSVQQMDVTIDGAPVPNLRDHRAISPTGFSITLPEANVLQHLGITADVAGTYTPQVSDGYWLMLAPLSVGSHTIVVHDLPAPGNGDDPQFTYHITVRPVSLSLARQGTNVILSWSQTSSSYVLQTSSDLSANNWSQSSASVSALEGRYEVTLPLGNGSQFFRLRKN